MRLHYDQTLPKIMEELTGEKGKVVDFGEHQNAFEEGFRGGNNPTPNPMEVPRPDLIFKNPDGTPKTTITARQYPIENTKDNFSMFRNKYQESSELGSNEKFQDETALKLNDSQSKALAKSSPVSPSTLPVSRTPFELHLAAARPEIDKIASIDSPSAKPAAKGLTKFYENYTLNRGNLVNKFARNVRSLVDLDSVIKSIFTHPLDYVKQNTAELNNVRDWFWAKQDGSKEPTLSANEQTIKGEVQRAMRQVRDEAIKRGSNSGGKLREVEGYNSDYLPNTVNSKVINAVIRNPDSPEARGFIKDFNDYQIAKGKSIKEANEALAKFVEGYSKKEVNIADQFGPIDKSQGIGIPKSWRDPNLIDSVTRYLDRVSRRFAYHDAIENTDALAAIKHLKGDKSIEAVFGDVTGNKYYDDPALNAAMGIVRAGMLGPLTGGRDYASNMTLGFQHHEFGFQPIKNFVKALGNMKENIADGFETGRLRTHMNSLEFNNGFDDYVHILKKIPDILTDLSGRNWFDQMARATSLGQGKFTTLDFHEQYLNGNLSKQGKAWFENFAKDIDWQKPNLSPEEVKQIAARYVDSVQGTYDYRGLPRQAVEGSFLSPILKLSLWNIEKANNFIKHTVNPLLQGNPKPALMSTVGILLGGAAVNALTEAVTGRKQKTATFEEIKNAPPEAQKMALFYKLAGLSSAAGHMGVLGDITKSILDLTYGKNRPQVYNNILVEAAENTVTTSANLIKSINEDGFDPNTVVTAIDQMMQDNFQTYRLLLAHVSADKKEQLERANKFRDLRVFNTLDGNTITDLTSPFSQSLEGLKLKEFKQAKTVEEARAMLPQLLQDALDKSKDDPERLKKELSKIKRNSYQTMPSPDRIPQTFLRYISFLAKTQGSEEAKKRLIDYVEQNAVNKAKVDGL
jgi:hypothetical protein